MIKINDKILHTGFSAVIYLISAILFQSVNKAIVLTFGIGIFKELLDILFGLFPEYYKKIIRKAYIFSCSKFNWSNTIKDIIADIVGIIFGIGILIIIGIISGLI